MKTKCYYHFPWTIDLENLLKSYNVDYEKIEWKPVEGSVVSYPDTLKFTIFKEDEKYVEIQSILPLPNVCWLEFSEKELKEATWLYMRSTNMKIDIENNSVDWFCPNNKSSNEKSMFHMTQTMPFEIKPVKWTNNNHFYSSYICGYDVIFCDDYAMNAIKRNNLIGVDFADVMWFKKNQVIPNVHQIKCFNILPTEAFLFDENCKPQKCPTCDKIKYEINQEFRIKIKREYLDDNLDFYSTTDVFSMGDVSSYTIVSNRVYSALKKENLVRNLKFEPVILI